MTVKHRPSFLDLSQFKDPETVDQSLQKEKSLEAQKIQFGKKFRLLLADQIKRKEIIHLIQEIAKKKSYDLHSRPTIANETSRFEWFVASLEPTLIDALYYLYFWVLLKGKYLLDDIDGESVNKLKKKKSFYGTGSANGSTESIYIESPSKPNPIANHHSTTRFEKDILKAKKSVGDLRSQFAKIINDEQQQNAIPYVLGNGKSPLSTPRKTSFNNLTPTASPVTKKFTMNLNGSSNSINNPNGSNSPTLAHKFSELNLMDSPYIKNVLKFKFDMSVYLNLLVDGYSLNKEVLPLDFLLSNQNLPLLKIVFKDNKIANDIVHRIPGYEYMLFLAENPVGLGVSEHLKFVYQLLMDHLDAGLVWDLHSIHQGPGQLKSRITTIDENRAALFENFNKVLINLIFELYKDKTARENMVREFNSNPKHHTKINNLKLNYSILKFNETWKSWTELDFIALDNLMFPTKAKENNSIAVKRIELAKGQLKSYYAWDADNHKKIEIQYVKT